MRKLSQQNCNAHTLHAQQNCNAHHITYPGKIAMHTTLHAQQNCPHLYCILGQIALVESREKKQNFT